MGVRNELLNLQGLTSILYIIDWLSNKQYICNDVNAPNASKIFLGITVYILQLFVMHYNMINSYVF